MADEVPQGTRDTSLPGALFSPSWEGSGVVQTLSNRRTNLSPANGAGRNLIPLYRDLRNVTFICFISF